MPDIVFRFKARRATLDLVRVIERIQLVGSPLVLVMELSAPGEKYRSWFPGIEQRMAFMNAQLGAVVATSDRPQVRIFPTNKVVAELAATGDPINPDGAHFTARAHQAIGESLAEEIARWIDLEGHLDHRETGTFRSPHRNVHEHH